jgi:hypothetical protein
MKNFHFKKEVMDQTSEFKSTAQRIATLQGQRIQILNKPKAVNTWMKSAKELNKDLFLFQEYLKSIRNSYLNIREWDESASYLSFPRASVVFGMNSKERNDLDLQLIRYLELLQNKEKQLMGMIPTNVALLQEPLDAIFQDCFRSIRDYHKSMQKKRTLKDAFKKKYN